MTEPSTSVPPPPEQILMQMATGKWVSKALAVVADLGIADLLGGGARHVDDLAAAAGSGADGLYRLIRAMTAFGVFTELPGRRFENNAMSTLLRSDVPNSLRAMVRWLGEEGAWRAWSGLEYSVKTGKPAFDHILGTQVFDYFQAHPETGRIFNDAMSSFTAVTGPAVAKAYDFSGINTLVDVGGGHGALLARICQQHPGVRGVVFHRPEVVAGAGPLLAAEGVADRIRTEGGDFFERVTVGADAYIMKHIIHDWDDAHCVRILTNCRQAVAPGGKVLIVDQVVTDGPESVYAKLSDLEMLVMTTGGRERTAEEFGRVLAAAGLTLTRIVPTESPVAVIESVAE